MANVIESPIKSYWLLRHWLEVLAIIAAAIGLAYFGIQWAAPSISHFVAANWGWMVVSGIIVLFGGTSPWTVPLGWKAFRAIDDYSEAKKDRQQQRELIAAATVKLQQGYNTKYINQIAGITLEVANPVKAIAAPAASNEQEENKDTLPPVIHYESIAHQVPRDMSLLGIHPDDGSLELTDWERLKAVWLVGSSSTGKSNTIYGKALEAVNKGAKLVVVDQHIAKDDSLGRKLSPLIGSFLRPIAVKDAEVLETLKWFKEEFERRVNGAPCEQKIVLICDEMNRMVRNDDLKKPLQEIVAICGEESRGFGMYGWFLSQKCAGLKWLRDSAITVIVHRLTRFEEALLACNDDRQAAKKLLTFKVGRTYIYGVDFDEPMELQQPLYPAPRQDHPTTYPDGYSAPTLPLQTTTSTDEVIGSGRVVDFTQHQKQREAEMAENGSQAQKNEYDEGRIARVAQMMIEGKSVNFILKEEWGVASAGGAYQAALTELREIQKIIAKRAVGPASEVGLK